MKYIIQGDILTVIVDGNNTTGFTKDVGIFDTSVLQHLKTEYSKDSSKSLVNIGGGGSYLFYFKIKHHCDTEIEIRTGRCWDQNSFTFEKFNLTV